MSNLHFTSELHPYGQSDYYSYLHCSKCYSKMDLYNNPVNQSCSTQGCSYLVCKKCYFSEKICTICLHGNKLINSNTFDDEKKQYDIHKKESNNLLCAVICTLDLNNCEKQKYILVIDGKKC